MKNVLSFIIFFFVLQTSVFGQRLAIGVQLGSSLSFIDNPINGKRSLPILSANGSIDLTFNINEQVYILAKLQSITKGYAIRRTSELARFPSDFVTFSPELGLQLTENFSYTLGPFIGYSLQYPGLRNMRKKLDAGISFRLHQKFNLFTISLAYENS